jgi:poly(3-hydroxybutyrate) depolymerase
MVVSLITAGSRAAGRREFTFESRGAPPVLVHLYVPPTVSRTTRVAVVMHGRLRNAQNYLDAWADWASERDHLIVAPRFDCRNWPGSRSYNLGNVLATARRSRSFQRPEQSWAFSVLEAVCARVCQRFGLEDPPLTLWGHSAGAQFVHRFLLFKPSVRVRAAIAAGCGWFTEPDLETGFPYGLRHPALTFTPADLRHFARRPLMIMRGTRDTGRDLDLRMTPGAEAQGSNRYERAAHAVATARRADSRTGWRLVDVPGVAHDCGAMAVAAQSILS